MGAETIKLQLSGGYVAVIDSIDVDLAQFKWSARVDRERNTVYARRTVVMPNGKQKTLRLHRVIFERVIGRPLAEAEKVDHIDRDGLNDRRSNLRLATTAQNCANTKLSSKNTSGHKGVSWNKAAGKWHAKICVNRRQIHLGLFDDINDAIRVRREHAVRYQGEFANDSEAHDDRL